MSDVIFKLPPIERGGYSLAAPESWAMKAFGIDTLRSRYDGSKCKVAILDTGVDVSHPEFAGGRILGFRDFVGDGLHDANGHGTHTTATVGGNSSTVGVSKCGLYHGKVLSDGGSGGDTGISDGIDWAIRQGVDIISMSLGSSSPAPRIEQAIIRATDAGIWVVVAAGNSGQGGVDYPGRYLSAFSCAAVDRNFSVASFSSRGDKLDVSGPGVDITSARPGGGYVNMSGTSMSTPFVAGALSLYRHGLKEKFMKVPSVYELRKQISYRAQDLGTVGDDTNYGPGWLNPALLLLGITPDPAPVE